MKSILLFAFLLFSTGLFTQTKDEQGRKQGYWKKTDEKTGKLIYEGRFKDDQPIGTFKYYNINDSVKAIIDFKADGKTSYVRLFHYNGKMSAQGKYCGKEQKDSIWTYYDELGVLISRESYKNGKKHGPAYVYLPDGVVSEERNFHEGLEEGTFLQYFDKNLVKAKGNYQKGFREGRFIYYYPNGVEVANGFFKHDLKNGPWIYRSEDGKIKEKELYKNGNQASKKETEAFFSKNKTQGSSNGTKSEKPPGSSNSNPK